ncbi:methyltransferase domain-containing protein [Streptomonospora wellingtoniae]|uniref:methyltransferase domain-containing protein n=1 Tax=Streptomonospora wellingtoniae TaxID=3075544 RepID=UPI002889B736|nr:methyltransferase domain-containing protein [Streptomonospora sp. DSM 45055]
MERTAFIPDRVWPRTGQPPLDRAERPQEWADLVDSDASVVTQVDDGQDGGIGRPTSSSSAPGVMARMLEALDVRPGMRVLEIGTGTGYNAAILAELVGPAGMVTTVEVDSAVSRQARTNLEAAAPAVRVVTGDGEQGHPPGAPYDRVIATCSVTRIPPAWLTQVAEGAVMVAPWIPSPDMPGGVLARLTVQDGSASGRFVEHTSFMLLRAHRWDGEAPHDFGADPDEEARANTDPRETVLDEDAGPALALMVPGWRVGMRHPAPGAEHYVWVSATGSASWARLHGDGRVEQGGPRRLWAELVEARQWWVEHGCPGVTDFGVTVDVDGRHRVWLGGPDGPSWTHPGTTAFG